MKKIFEKSRGQVMVLYAGAFAFALCGAIAMGTDVAMMYVNWQQAQKTVDAAALAGANYREGIAYSGTISTGCSGESSTDTATEAACTYAVNNGLPASSITISEPTASSIQVAASETTLPYYFGKVLGLTTYSVATTATANAPGPVNTVTQGMFPAGIQCTAPCTGLSDLVPGQSISFGAKHVLDLSPSNYQWLSIGGNGASVLESNIENGVTTSFSIGDAVDVSSGAKTGPVSSAINERLDSCPAISDPCSGSVNPSNIPANDPCLVIVPAVDFTASPVVIEGFAEVYLENTSSATQLNGCFIQAVAGNTSTASGAPGLGPSAPPVLTN